MNLIFLLIQAIFVLVSLLLSTYIFVYRLEVAKDISRMGLKLSWAMRKLLLSELLISLGVSMALGAILLIQIRAILLHNGLTIPF